MDPSPKNRWRPAPSNSGDTTSEASAGPSARLLSKAPFTGYTRSISLPQALHSIGFGSKKYSTESDSTQVRSAAGSVDANEEFLRKASDPASSSDFVKRVTSDRFQPRPLGRSETSPHVSRPLRAPATQGAMRHQAAQPDMGELGLHCKQLRISTPTAAQRALSNPDILWCIFDALDAMSVIPREVVLQRRKPLSLRHAQMMFGNDKEAWEAWEKNQTTTTEPLGSGLFNCLFVNSTWYDSAARILEARIYFSGVEHFTQFSRRGVQHLSRKPRMFVLHKLNDLTQVELDLLDGHSLGEQLEWLEFYTCSGLAPSPSLLGPQLKRVILPGCVRVNDRTLSGICEQCPQLEQLDVRACEQVSDRGIKIVAKRCPQLRMLNVGRNGHGELITYKGIKHIARQTQISTLGVAGCYIDDRAIWELALSRGSKIQRLSLNNCYLLTDASVPRVLGYMPNLNVLEIRGCTNITHMRPLALYRAYREKHGQVPLIECCEVIERRLQVAIMRLQRETSVRVLTDLTTFINENDYAENGTC